jgi:UDP-N-acetylmuramate dehydrogenase
VIDGVAREALEEAAGDAVRFDVPMSRYTSLRVGGPVDAMATPGDRRALARVLRVCAAHRIPCAVMGKGFNSIVRDEGLVGVALQLSRFRDLCVRPGKLIRGESGVSHSQLTRFCQSRGLAGLEFGAGIPGSLGGWISMNAGIPGREVKDVVRELEVMSPTGARTRHLGRQLLRFGYRALRGLAPGSVILSALLEIRVSTPAAVKGEVSRLLAERASRQPLDLPSCGSVFKNPPGAFAGQLIEAAGLKGERIGGAQISPTHANFIVNTGGATASDVISLIAKARALVRFRTGIVLEPEVKILGRSAS